MGLDERYAAMNERVNKLASEIASLKVTLPNNLFALNRRINETNDKIQAILKKIEKASR